MADVPTREELERAKESLAIAKEELELASAEGIETSEIVRLLRERSALVREFASARKVASADLQDEVAALENQLELTSDRGEQLKIQTEQAQRRLKIARNMSAVDAESNAAREEAIKDAEEELKLLEKQTEELAKQKKQLEAAKGFGKELGDSIAVYGRHTVLNTKNLAKFGNALQHPIAFVQALSTAGAMAFVDTMINLAFELDKMESSFRKTTGASAGMARSVTSAYTATRLYGVTTKEAEIAASSLYTTVTDFTFMNRGVQQQMIQSTAVLEKFGVSSADSAKSMQIATKAFGMSGEQAQQTMLDITKYAREIGVAPGQMAQRFAAAGPEIAKFGGEAVDVFKDLERVYKITGIETQRLLQITSKFDTFEGAAKQAGMLNAALGGNFVNAMDLMMTTDPVQRFEMLRDAITNTGLSFDDMSYYQRLFYTESLGLKDVGELAAFMSGDMEALGDATMKSSADFAKMREEAAQLQDVQTQLKALLMDMIPVFMPLIDGLRDMAQWLRKDEDRIKKLGQGLLIFAGIMILGKVISFGLSVAFGILGTAAATAMVVTGKGAKSAAIGVAALGAAALGIGVGVGVAAAGIGLMALGVSKLNADQLNYFTGALFLFGGAIAALFAGLLLLVAFGPATAAAEGILLGIGIAAGLVGIGIGIAAAGIGVLVFALSDMFKELDLKQFALLAIAFFSLGALVTTMGVLFPFAALGVIALGLALVTLAGGMYLMSLSMAPFTSFVNSISTLMDKAESLKMIAEHLKAVREEINLVNKTEAMALAGVMASTAYAVTAVATRAPAAPTVAANGGTTTTNNGQPITVNVAITGEDVGNMLAGQTITRLIGDWATGG